MAKFPGAPDGLVSRWFIDLLSSFVLMAAVGFFLLLIVFEVGYHSRACRNSLKFSLDYPTGLEFAAIYLPSWASPALGLQVSAIDLGLSLFREHFLQ